MGNPRVFQGYPYPYPPNTPTHTSGRGIWGVGVAGTKGTHYHVPGCEETRYVALGTCRVKGLIKTLQTK